MEANDLCFEPLILKVGLGVPGLALMVILDALAIGLCVLFIARLFRVR